MFLCPEWIDGVPVRLV